MKPLILFTLLCTLLSCQKSDVQPVLYNTPIEVHYVLKSKEGVQKRVVCKLWASDYKREKRVLVATLDTLVTENVDLILVQNDAPYIYAYTSCVVTCEQGDIMSMSIGSAGRDYVHRSGSCATNSIEFENEYLTLYK